MRVLCIQSRQVANDVYVEGEEYEVEEARALSESFLSL